jgi:hypothetical protein
MTALPSAPGLSRVRYWEPICLTGESECGASRQKCRRAGALQNLADVRVCGQRVSVLECGGPPPLSTGARAELLPYMESPLPLSRMHWDLEPT